MFFFLIVIPDTFKWTKSNTGSFELSGMKVMYWNKFFGFDVAKKFNNCWVSWHCQWKEGRIGFHCPHVLEKY